MQSLLGILASILLAVCVNSQGIPFDFDPLGTLAKKLPYDSRIEYLESTGTQWIELDYVPNNKTVAIMDVQSTDVAVMLNGVFSATNRFNFGISTTAGNPWFAGIGSANTAPLASADTNRRTLTLSAPTKTYSISGVGDFACGSGSVDGNTSKMELFARNVSGSKGSNAGKMKVFACVLQESGTNVCDLIPVRIGTVGFMYDKVSGLFFGNSGAGSFVLGPDTP